MKQLSLDFIKQHVPSKIRSPLRFCTRSQAQAVTGGRNGNGLKLINITKRKTNQIFLVYLSHTGLHLTAQGSSGICRWGHRFLKKAPWVLFTSTKPNQLVCQQEHTKPRTERGILQGLPKPLLFSGTYYMCILLVCALLSVGMGSIKGDTKKTHKTLEIKLPKRYHSLTCGKFNFTCQPSSGPDYVRVHMKVSSLAWGWRSRFKPNLPTAHRVQYILHRKECCDLREVVLPLLSPASHSFVTSQATMILSHYHHHHR